MKRSTGIRLLIIIRLSNKNFLSLRQSFSRRHPERLDCRQIRCGLRRRKLEGIILCQKNKTAMILKVPSLTMARLNTRERLFVRLQPL